MSKPNILAQGAEAIIIHESSNVIKDRVSKGYRHPVLDKKIIKSRTKSEAKILEKASRLIPVPVPSKIEFNEITMPFIAGQKLSEKLENLDYKNICKIIGNQIAKLHDNNIIHGDLTTSNMIWVDNSDKECKIKSKDFHQISSKDIALNKSKKEVAELVQATSNSREVVSKKPLGVLHFIDFGLGFISNRIEDKAVDLHLIKQALEAKHFTIHKECEKIILKNYNSKDKIKVLEQLKKVESRGRYKH